MALIVRNTFWFKEDDVYEQVSGSRPRSFSDTCLIDRTLECLADALSDEEWADKEECGAVSDVETEVASTVGSYRSSTSSDEDFCFSAASPPGVWAVAPQMMCIVPVQGLVLPADTQRTTVVADVPEEIQGSDLKTVMLRNIPNNYSRQALLELMDKQGFAGKYDFVYLPMDFNRNANLGYAFVNLVTADDVEAFWHTFDNFSWDGASKKICKVTWSSPCQGVDDHIERYRNSPLMHDSVPEEARPALFKNGQMIEFPRPTKTIRAPRCRLTCKKPTKH
jgi:hypothetical protein